jgi:uncharacterized repeat protein (TIGR01451 family)/LPXTG-motif cell wall-anchored protein
MSKLTSLIRRAPKRFSAVALIIAAAVIIPTVALAWGPSRETFTIANPSDHVQFNSITDNPNVGDERNFVGVRESGSANTWYDSLNVQSGKTYTVRMYVHNNAATSLNLVANNVTAKVDLPTTTGKSVDINGFISASNVGANTKGNNGAYAEVYDDAKLTSTQDFNLAYVAGSLKYDNNAGTFTLPESIFTSNGAKLGYSQMDGNIPGCFQYSGFVTFQVKPQFATPTTYTFSKMVSKHGENKWTETYAAQPSETVDYLLQYKNTSATQQDDVTFRDTLPTGMTYVNGSTTFGNAKTPAGVKASDNIANGTGINVGSYAAGANAWAIFSAKAPTVDQLICGPTTLVNTGKVNVAGTSESDTANITLNKTCAPGTINVCQLSTKTIVNIKESDFDSSKYSKNLDDCKTVPPVTPPELPHTGMSENIVAIVGLGALIASIAYYVASRRALNQ